MWAAGSVGRRQWVDHWGDESGFSLLELLVAITIAALVLGVAAPASIRMYSSMQYHGAVKDVVAVLTSARYSAISRGDPQDVLVSPREGELSLNEKTQRLPASIALEVVAAKEFNQNGAGVIRFYSDGSSSGGVVRLSHERGMGVEVQVDWLLGRIDLCKADCGDFP